MQEFDSKTYIKLQVIRYSTDIITSNIDLGPNIDLTVSVSAKVLVLTNYVKFINFVKRLD